MLLKIALKCSKLGGDELMQSTGNVDSVTKKIALLPVCV